MPKREGRAESLPRPKFIFLNPTVPAGSGQGSAMRAGVFLELLAEHYEVTLSKESRFWKRWDMASPSSAQRLEQKGWSARSGSSY
jgi:hypothetical protein